ncbi:MAG: NnrS family protein [Kiloniellaceae bacterium]
MPSIPVENDRVRHGEPAAAPRETTLVLLQMGFRPFFLAAAGWAVGGLGLWLAILTGLFAVPSAFDPIAWHGHEMIFGYAGAAVAGFLLTAIPNWTGRLPVRGLPLAGLALVWLAGRGAVAVSDVIGPGVAAAIDLAFPALLLATVAREIVAGRNKRNLVMVLVLGLLLAGNALMHWEAITDAPTAALGWRVGLAALILLIALVGGRVTPSFTRNWLAKRGATVLPRPFSGLDRVALLIGAAALALWVAAPEARVAGAALVLAGAGAALRLSRWRGLHIGAEPLVLILHMGQGWLALGLVLLGLAILAPAIPVSAGLHALTTGAVGTMTLAIMTRATLGHAGRPLRAGLGTSAIYALITLAAAVRVAAAWPGDLQPMLLTAGGLAWLGAFTLYLALYGPILLGAGRGRGREQGQ